jgi:hypothetical protein
MSQPNSTHRRRPTRLGRAVALIAMAALAPWIAACSRQPVAESDEISLARQVEDVRVGQSNQIRVDRTAVTDADLRQLEGLEEKLERINISQSSITDVGLARLGRFKRLEQLRLASPRASDAGLESLEQLSRLRFLHLIDAPISDAGLDRLQSLPMLESLYLDGANLTDAGIDRFIKARPQVHLHIDGGHHHTDPHADDHEHEGKK